MRTYTLKTLLPLFIVVSFVAWLLFFFGYEKYQLEQQLNAQSRSNLAERLATAQRHIENLLTEGKPAQAWAEVMHLNTVDNIDEVSILDPQLTILIGSQREWVGRSASDMHQPFDAALARESLAKHKQILHLTADGDFLLGMQPIQFPATRQQIRSEQEGLLFVKYNLQPRRGHIWRDLVNNSLIMVVSAVVLIVLFQWFCRNRCLNRCHICCR